MTIDATFWVAISFIIFILLLFYFKIPAKVQSVLDDNINKIKGQIDEAESLKEEAKSNLANQEKKLADSKTEIQSMINDATSAADRKVKKSNEDLESFLKIKRKNTSDKIKQMKSQALKDIKNTSVEIAVESAERVIKNSLDKSKLDEIFKLDSANLYLCNNSLMWLIGTHIDYIEDIMGSRFDFKNQNQESKCGCGTSFNFKNI